MLVALMVVVPLAVAFVWRRVSLGRLELVTAMTPVLVAAGGLAVLTGRVRVATDGWRGAVIAGVIVGVAFWGATRAFVAFALRFPHFARQVEAIYGQSLARSRLLVAILGAAGAVGEELFWRGLFQRRSAVALSPVGGAIATWLVYAVANLPSRSGPIVVAGVVGGLVWGGLALATGDVLASVCCHGVWTTLMVTLPPVGRDSR